MTTLPTDLRNKLERVVIDARDAAAQHVKGWGKPAELAAKLNNGPLVIS